MLDNGREFRNVPKFTVIGIWNCGAHNLTTLKWLACFEPGCGRMLDWVIFDRGAKLIRSWPQSGTNHKIASSLY